MSKISHGDYNKSQNVRDYFRVKNGFYIIDFAFSSITIHNNLRGKFATCLYQRMTWKYGLRGSRPNGGMDAHTKSGVRNPKSMTR